jgi:hypothetical protein
MFVFKENIILQWEAVGKGHEMDIACSRTKSRKIFKEINPNFRIPLFRALEEKIALLERNLVLL